MVFDGYRRLKSALIIYTYHDLRKDFWKKKLSEAHTNEARENYAIKIKRSLSRAVLYGRDYMKLLALEDNPRELARQRVELAKLERELSDINQQA